jgi:hypothetical protein
MRDSHDAKIETAIISFQRFLLASVSQKSHERMNPSIQTKMITPIVVCLSFIYSRSDYKGEKGRRNSYESYNHPTAVGKSNSLRR